MSRSSTLYASAYDTERLHEVRLLEGAQRPLRIDLNGVLAEGETVASVVWDASGQVAAQITDPAKAARSFSAWLTGANRGTGVVEARATASDGSVSVHRVSIWVI